jgi:cysteine-rich repeat protein
MTKRGVLLLATAMAGAILPGCSNDAAHSPSAKSDDSTDRSGATSLSLTIGGGAVLSTVHYQVSGEGIPTASGDIPVDASGATASLLLRLPAGKGYTVSFNAKDASGNTSCTGTATFDVTAGATNGVTVPLSCTTPDTRGNQRLNGTFDSCPEITQLVVVPLSVDIDGKISVSASATDVDNDSLAYAWSDPFDGGNFDDPTAKSTKFTCAVLSSPTLIISVSDGQGCVTTASVNVACTGEHLCGSGVIQPGETCDPPIPGFCSSTCQLIAPHCGDGFVQPAAGETCEPPNTATCSATCQSKIAECGNGIVEPPFETCDPPNPATGCSPTCQVESSCDQCLAANCAALKADCDATSGGPSGCDTVSACIQSSGCAANSTRQATECYCGANVDDTTCFGFNANAPQGPCKDVMNAAVPGGPLAVGASYFDTTTGLGSAVQEALCKASFCALGCGPQG